MSNYQNGKIYKLVDLDNRDTYIGSTTQSLAKRKYDHNAKYKSYMKGKYHYVTSFDIIKNDNFDIYLIENYPCQSKEELHAREGYWQRKIDCVNRITLGRTQKEYYDDNKEIKSIQRKEKIICECGCITNRSGILAHKKTNRHKILMKKIHQELLDEAE